MAVADHDRSQLERQVLGDLAALIAVREYLFRQIPPDPHAQEKVEDEIGQLIAELWP